MTTVQQSFNIRRRHPHRRWKSRRQLPHNPSPELQDLPWPRPSLLPFAVAVAGQTVALLQSTSLSVPTIRIAINIQNGQFSKLESMSNTMTRKSFLRTEWRRVN